ncbi:MAG: segregation/condensation protein A [Cyanobacteria bacterium SIG26]|nr:segregation/condensation protein A [Cyanobacteria bacterium SIG26]
MTMNNNLINAEDLENSIYSPRGEFDANDGIGILVDMAKQGKIDPWNIDILDVTEKYLQRMIELKSLNLRVASRTLLFASILCRLQSNVLAGLSLEEFQDEPEPIYDEDGFIVEYPDEEQEFIPTSNVVSFDEALQRRTSIRLNRNRVVTLKDLIKQLEFYEKLEKRALMKSAHERAKRHVRNYSRLTPDEIVSMAHEEYIEESVLKLKDNLEQIFDHQEKIELNELIVLGLDKISAYLALLFLSRDTDYELEQKEFYSDLYVVKGGRNAAVEI